MWIHFFRPEAGRLRRGTLLALGGLTLALGGFWGSRYVTGDRATAQTFAGKRTDTALSIPNSQSSSSDYQSRVVAYIGDNTPVTRQELGEYLIARYGVEKLPTLVNKKLIERECWSRGVVITAAEVDSALASEIRGLAVDQATFLKMVMRKHKKNLIEFKEDVLRPRLQMMALVGSRVKVSDDDLRKAYESLYGEKIEGRLILWKKGQERTAIDNYTKLRDSEALFDEAARNQSTPELAAGAGKIKPFGRYAMDEAIEKEAFKLRPGQVSQLIELPQGVAIFKCDRRLPADTSVSLDAVRERLTAELREKKLEVEIVAALQALRDQVKPQLLLKPIEKAPNGPLPSPSSAVAFLGSEAITREELGEFLIARFGAEKLELLVNRKILDQACAEQNVTVTDAEIDERLDADLKNMKMSRDVFVKEILANYGKTLFEWREDVVRSSILLSRLSAGRAKVTDEDLKKCFEAHYGERLQCRMILYPPNQQKHAIAEYNTIRDNEAEFDRVARNQAVPSLASQHGKMPIFGRYSLGDENLEREAFRLQPGELSPIIDTPQGKVVLKLDRRIPPDKSVTLEQVKDKLTAEILAKKNEIEMQVYFAELKEKAKPRLLLKASTTPQDVIRESDNLLKPGK
ncbi:MAG: peptidylprolyl isomerase [Gemmataceae bacterium]